MGLQNEFDRFRVERYLRLVCDVVKDERILPRLMVRRFGADDVIDAIDCLKVEFDDSFCDIDFLLTSILMAKPFVTTVLDQSLPFYMLDNSVNVPNVIGMYCLMKMGSHGEYRQCHPCRHISQCEKNQKLPKIGDVCLQRAEREMLKYKSHNAQSNANELCGHIPTSLKFVILQIEAARDRFKAQAKRHS